MKFTRKCITTGTCGQGHINTDYATLVGCFGEPDGNFDDYKSDANWDITFADGTVASIYNWKNGFNYCGREHGLPVEEIQYWNIGGNSRRAVTHVEAALDAYLKSVCYQAPEQIEYFGA